VRGLGEGWVRERDGGSDSAFKECRVGRRSRKWGSGRSRKWDSRRSSGCHCELTVL